MEKHQKNRLLIATIGVLITLIFYNVLWGPTLEAPLWGKILFPVLQAISFYLFMRWVTLRFGHKKNGERQAAD